MATPWTAAVILAAALPACAAGAQPAPVPLNPAAVATVAGDTLHAVSAPCRVPSTPGMVWLWHPTDPPIRVGSRLLPATGRSCVVRPDSLPRDARPDDGPADEPRP